jgi:two-component system chemotaxis response regulator CheB
MRVTDSNPHDAVDRHDEAGVAVFIGGSAGSIEALAELLARLPGDLAAPVLVVVHVSRTGITVLPAILDRVGELHAVTPTDGDALADTIVYVAPRGQHMIVEGGAVRLNEGPTEHGLRPAIDPLFRSAARAYGSRAIGVILSGMLDDGTAGLREIRARGGWTLVQAPEEAAFPNMPESAIANVDVDYVLPTAELAVRIEQLVVGASTRAGRLAPESRGTVASFDADFDALPGMRTDITCPQCGGVLWEEVEGRLTMYRCRSGHAYSADTLLAVQGEGLDTAIWRPIRMLHERGALLRRLAERAKMQGRMRSAAFFEQQADDALRRATEMRRAVTEAERRGVAPAERPDDEPAKPK